ncbi:MAG: tetratricopeptide repeat protein [Lutibacter sp.]
MKIILTSIILTLSLTSMLGQNCENYEDCFAKGKTEKEAIEYFTKAIKFAQKENMNPSRAYFWRGIEYYKLSKGPESIKENKSAEADFLEALKNDPDYYSIVDYLASFYKVKAKDYAKAIAFMDSQITLKPNNAMAYFDRGNIHRYYNKNDLALADFKKAYEIMEAGTQSPEMSKSYQGYIPTFYVLLKLKNENTNIHTSETLAILEKANQLAPNNDKILSELALAYFDDGNSAKAIEIAKQALDLQEFKKDSDAFKTQIPGAQVILAFDAYNRGLYDEASYRSGAADAENARIFPHPVIAFFRAIISYDRFSRLYPNQWLNYQTLITKRLEKAVELADGTQYQSMADDAKMYLDKIKFPYGKPEDDPNFEIDLKDFLINFDKLPSSFSFTSRAVKARDITKMPYTKKRLRLDGDIGAIGKITECGGNHILIISLRNGSSTYFRFMKIGPKGEYLGWKPITSITLYGGKASSLMEVNISVRNNELIVKTKDTYFETGRSHSDEIKANCTEEWKI